MAESTALCTEDEAPCASNHQPKHLHFSSTEKRIALLTSLGNVECDVMLLVSAKELGAPQVLEGTFIYLNCGKCTVTEVNGPTVFKFLREGHETASATYEGEMHVVCTAINCYYNGVGLKWSAKGPLLSAEENGEITIQEQEAHKVKGLFCPSTNRLDILLTTPIAPHYTQTEAGATTLCKVDPGTGSSEVCPAKRLVTGIDQQTLLDAKAKFLTSSGAFECEVTYLGGSAESGSPLEIHGTLYYTGCSGCTIAETPYTFKISKLGHETADVTGEGEIHVVCEGINCYYAEGLTGTAKGPLLSVEANGEIAFNEKELHAVKGTQCPTTAKLDLVLTTPSAPYISS